MAFCIDCGRIDCARILDKTNQEYSNVSGKKMEINVAFEEAHQKELICLASWTVELFYDAWSKKKRQTDSIKRMESLSAMAKRLEDSLVFIHVYPGRSRYIAPGIYHRRSDILFISWTFTFCNWELESICIHMSVVEDHLYLPKGRYILDLNRNTRIFTVKGLPLTFGVQRAK